MMQRAAFDPKLLKAAVYGANDGIITTFAVVAGVSGAGLSAKIIVILGIANMVADAISMGIGDFLGERSERKLRKFRSGSFSGSAVWETGLVTFLAFVLAGSLPLLPYLLRFLGVGIVVENQFYLSIVSTAGALFVVGSLRTMFIGGSWLKNGLEMLAVGSIAAVAAYMLGYFVDQLVDG